MSVGVLVIEILIYASSSLKEKRFTVRSIRDRLKNKYNVAVSEIDFQDKWQRSKIGIVTISNHQTHVENSLHQIFNYLDQADEYEIISYEYSYF